jgi:hypothetical protein
MPFLIKMRGSTGIDVTNAAIPTTRLKVMRSTWTPWVRNISDDKPIAKVVTRVAKADISC